jgi:hypothetical protein
MARTPSMTSSIRPASFAATAVIRLPNGRNMMFADMTPHSVATNAPAMRWPSLLGSLRFSST